MSDLISRKATVDEINERQRKLIYCFGFENDMVKIMDIAKSIVLAIPSAQPEIIRCKDCVLREGEPIADGRYWCQLHGSFMYYCSDAERGENEMNE